MFTGIVEELGEVVSVQIAPDGADAVIAVRGPAVTTDARTGDSIAVSGVCLTVIRMDGDTFTADVMYETLSRTTAASWRSGSRVNLERSVTPTTRMGGHLVQGHVDGVGTVTARTAHPGYDELTIRVPAALGRYLAAKGAIAVDGVSLTVIDVTDVNVTDVSVTDVSVTDVNVTDAPATDVAVTDVDSTDVTVTDSEGAADFTLGIIPQTRAVTTLGGLALGDSVNIEVDVMAKYAERLLAGRGAVAAVPAQEPAQEPPREPAHQSAQGRIQVPVGGPVGRR